MPCIRPCSFRAMNHESLLNTNDMVCKWANVAYYTAYKVIDGPLN